MTNFLVELTGISDVVILPTPSNEYPKHYDIYEIDISQPPAESYWTDWGGFYDNFVGTQIEIYYEQYLTRTNSLSELFNMPFSVFLRDDFMALINIPRHPWLYPDYATEGEEVLPFLSSALNPDDPSFNIVRGMNAPVKLEIPSFSVKLSENINGVVLNQGFSVSLNNNNGYFDDINLWNLFNKPLHLKKATVENPEYEDFKTIRNGLVENTSTTFDKIHVNVSDRFRAMGEPVCEVIRQQMFPGIVIDERNLNKNIPVVYGRNKVTLLKLNETNYIAAEYVSEITGVFDREGNSLAFTFNPINNVITSTDNAHSAVIVGYTDNKIGNIIIDLVTRKTDIQFNNTNWNLDEVNQYITNSYPVNIVINRGDVRRAVQSVLTNDMAYFIQQMDGRFTIRKYGIEYKRHTIPSWSITQKPQRTNDSAQENFFSSCVINYNYFDESYNSYLFNERENQAENDYKRRVLRTFDTGLIYENDARDLAVLLSDRFTSIKQTIRLALGFDTSGFELLDTVEIDLKINDRKFNYAAQYFIKEINPAQDILVIEEL